VSALLPRAALSFASRAFGLGARVRRVAYDLGALPIEHVEGASIISLGNIRAGGSGKSPVALWLASAIAAGGAPAAIALRGYRGDLSARGAVVSRGRGPLVCAREAGDEAYLAALRAPEGVSVYVGADRVAAVRRAVRDGARAVVLDDGFQHRRLARDCDVALVCPEDLSPETRLLPLGPLREAPGSLARADVVAGFSEDWRGREGAPAVLFDAAPLELVATDGTRSDLDAHGQRAFLFSGIARPERFTRSAQAAGLEVAGSRVFPDHYRYRARDLIELGAAAERCGAQLLLTTEKDLVRLGPAPIFPPIFALRLHMSIVAGAAILEESLRRGGVEVRSQRP
jgi:tetraacyldisaccharide 4'-kinase